MDSTTIPSSSTTYPESNPDTIFFPCQVKLKEDNSDVLIPSSNLESKAFFIDQSSTLFMAALSFLASFAVNSFVQSLFATSLKEDKSKPWEAIVYSFIYVVIVVSLAIGLLFPLAKAKGKRDLAAKNSERIIPTLVKCVNCAVCGKSTNMLPIKTNIE